MKTTAMILLVVSSCLGHPPSVTVEEAGFLAEWEATQDAWETDPSLPPIPAACDGLEVAFLTPDDYVTYNFGSDRGDATLSGSIVLMRDTLDDGAQRSVFVHEATHWLGMCTAYEWDGPGPAWREGNAHHKDPRLWDADGVVARAKELL